MTAERRSQEGVAPTRNGFLVVQTGTSMGWMSHQLGTQKQQKTERKELAPIIGIKFKS